MLKIMNLDTTSFLVYAAILFTIGTIGGYVRHRLATRSRGRHRSK